MLSVRWDFRPLLRSLERLPTAIQSETKNAINRVARAARVEFNATALREIGLKNGRAIGSTAAAELSLAAPGRLEAIFRPSRKTVNMGEVPFTGGRRRELLTVHTHGSKSFKEGFAFGPGKHARLMERTGRGKHDIKPLRTTRLATLMAQDDSNARAAWKGTAELGLEIEGEKALRQAFTKAGF